LAISIGAVKKGKMSVVIYAIAIPLALWQPLVAGGCYAIVALMWLVPDRRIENLLA